MDHHDTSFDFSSHIDTHHTSDYTHHDSTPHYTSHHTTHSTTDHNPYNYNHHHHKGSADNHHPYSEHNKHHRHTDDYDPDITIWDITPVNSVTQSVPRKKNEIKKQTFDSIPAYQDWEIEMPPKRASVSNQAPTPKCCCILL